MYRKIKVLFYEYSIVFLILIVYDVVVKLNCVTLRGRKCYHYFGMYNEWAQAVKLYTRLAVYQSSLQCNIKITSQTNIF